MKILNFGSLNIDNVYTVEEFVRPGETVTAKSHTVFAGGRASTSRLLQRVPVRRSSTAARSALTAAFLPLCSKKPERMPVICSSSTSPPVTLSLRSTPADRTAFSSGAAQTAG